MIDPKEFDLNKYTSNSSEGCVLKVDLEHPEELCKLYIDYPFVPDKIEIKKEMLSNYHLKIADFYDIFIDNVRSLLPNFFDKISMCFIIKSCTLFRARIKTKNNK